MLTIRPMPIDEYMRHDDLGRLQFCKRNNEAVLASFELQIVADSAEDWQIEDIYMGTQRITGGTFRRYAQYFETECWAEIIQHIRDNLQDAKDSTWDDEKRFRAGE